uniref:Uncharacterized protein n=1 Tax=Plectus sambesii TaxID=2011161 RepID=A0A914W0H7_9BILA
MLEAFKEKLQTVQQDLSSGIQKLRTRKSPSFYSLSSASTSSGLTGSVSAPSLVDANAGAEILDYYQRSWQLTHELSEDNARAANACSDRLRTLQDVCRRDAAGIAFINRDAAVLPKLAEELSDLVSLTAKSLSAFYKRAGLGV